MLYSTVHNWPYYRCTMIMGNTLQYIGLSLYLGLVTGRPPATRMLFITESFATFSPGHDSVYRDLDPKTHIMCQLLLMSCSAVSTL